MQCHISILPFVSSLAALSDICFMISTRHIKPMRTIKEERGKQDGISAKIHENNGAGQGMRIQAVVPDPACPYGGAAIRHKASRRKGHILGY